MVIHLLGLCFVAFYVPLSGSVTRYAIWLSVSTGLIVHACKKDGLVILQSYVRFVLFVLIYHDYVCFTFLLALCLKCEKNFEAKIIQYLK